MGAANSSNVTNVATDIGNTIQNSTTINQQQITSFTKKITFSNCDMTSTTGGFAATIYGITKLRQGQMDNVNGDVSLANNVAQSAIQSATSKVGSLGIGYANASNAVNMLCNVTNDVISNVSANETQIATSQDNISCNNTRINVRGNITFSITDSVDLVQTMVVKNSQVDNISNTVSQSVKQTASATVEGIAGALIAIAILIVAIGWSFGEVATSATSFLKPLITIGIAVLIGFIIFLAWYNSWGPFFNKLTPCSIATKIGNGSNFAQGSGIAQQPVVCDKCLIEDKSPQVVSLQSCPIKYVFPVIDKDSLGNRWTLDLIENINLKNSNLFDVAAISGSKNQKSGQSGTYNNSGYTIASLNYTNVLLAKFNTKLNDFNSLGIKNPIIKELVNLVKTTYPIPPLLTDPSGTIPSTSTALDTSTMKFITIPAQNQVVLQDNTPTDYDVITGVCTPTPFTWDKTTKIKSGDWTSWGMNDTKPHQGNCHKKGSYPLNGINKDLLYTSDPQYGLANSNKTAFINWMFNLSNALSTTSIIVNNDKFTAENVVSGFARTLLVFIINEWLLESGETSMEGSAYIFPWEILIITPPVNPSGQDNTFLTEPEPITLPPVMKGLDFSQYTMKYTPKSGSVFNLMSSIPASTPGTVEMVQGVCKNKHYELQHFMSTVGNWILLFIILVALIMIWRA